MPNKFEGQVQDNFDRKLKDVKVTLTGTGIPSGTFTKTDEIISLLYDVINSAKFNKSIPKYSCINAIISSLNPIPPAFSVLAITTFAHDGPIDL